MVMSNPGSGLDAFPIPLEWLSDVDRAFASEVRAYVDKEIVVKRQSESLDGGLLTKAWRGINVDLGLQSAIWPDRVGGAGESSPAAALLLTAVAEQVGRGDVGLGVLLASVQAMAASVVVGASDGDPRVAAWAPEFVADQPLRVALVMPSMGSGDGPVDEEGRFVQVVARADGEHRVLEADHARPLCGGADADWFGVVSAEEGELAMWWVPADAPGVRRHEVLKQTGLWSCPNAEVTLAGVRVAPESRWLAGTESVRSAGTWFQLLASASCVGALFATFEILSEWGESRVIKGRGQVFKNNPLAASVMAELAARVHRDRILVYNLAHMLAHPQDVGPAGADTVSVATSHLAQHVALSAEEGINRTMELMGSAGYAREWHLERYWRDVKGVQSCLGSQVLSSMRVARHHYGSTCR